MVKGKHTGHGGMLFPVFKKKENGFGNLNDSSLQHVEHISFVKAIGD